MPYIEFTRNIKLQLTLLLVTYKGEPITNRRMFIRGAIGNVEKMCNLAVNGPAVYNNGLVASGTLSLLETLRFLQCPLPCSQLPMTNWHRYISFPSGI